MRLHLSFVALLAPLVVSSACSEDEPGPAPAAAPSTGAPAAEAESEAPAAPVDEGPEMTEGFIRATIDGEAHRFEHLEADRNQATSRTTVLAAFDGPEEEHGVEILLTGWDVRDVEYPARFAHDIRSAVRGRDIRAAMRLPSFVYVQGGERHVAMFRDPPLECDRFEAQTLHCTFEIEVPRDGGGTIRVTDGELEIALKSNAMADAILEGTVGMAADEAVDRAQESLDRANMR